PPPPSDPGELCRCPAGGVWRSRRGPRRGAAGLGVSVDFDGLELALPPTALIALDASVTLAYLVGTEAVSPAATWIFDGCLSTGRNPGLLSTLTAAELLVRPFRAGDAAVGTVEGFLRFIGSVPPRAAARPHRRGSGARPRRAPPRHERSRLAGQPCRRDQRAADRSSGSVRQRW